MLPQKNNSAFTMIEVMAAMLILALVCVAYSENQVGAISLVKSTRYRDIAVMLASQKMAELNFRVQSKGIEDLKDEEKGDFDGEKFEGYSWRYTKAKVPPPDFSALMSAVGSAEEDEGEKSQSPQNSIEGPMKAIMEIWGKSILELRLEIVWKESEQEKNYTLMTHYIASDANKQIEGMIGAMMGGMGAGGSTP